MSRKTGDTRGLELDGSCWRLNIRIPVKLGGGRLRTRLGTGDIHQAQYIRDTYIMPVLVQGDALNAMRHLALLIQSTEKNIQTELDKLRTGILPQENLKTIGECIDLYLAFLNTSKLRDSTKRDYGDAIKRLLVTIDGTQAIDHLAKDDVIKLRNELTEEVSSTRLTWIIERLRTWARWCRQEGLCRDDIAAQFDIPLPTVSVEHTIPIPADKADACMTCKPGWTLAPRIARYSCMRLNEVLTLTAKSIVVIHGVKCWYIPADISKTHVDRYVPIADRLLPYIANLAELKRTIKQFQDYNVKVKKIASGCSFHSWRSYGISSMANAGVEEIIRKRIAGHKDDSVHAGYTVIDMQNMKAAIEKIK